MPSSGKCNIGQTDQGKSTSATIMEAAAIAIAVANTGAATYFADKQYDIAKQYLDIAKWWRNYYKSAYVPWENKELEEAKNLPIEQPYYDVAIGRSRTYGRLQFRGLAEKSIQCTSEYCTGLREALLKDVLNSEATTLAALSNLGYRNERAFVEARNDERWQRRAETLNRGRGMVANNVQFSQLAFGIFGDLGKQAGAGAAGAVRYLGYSWNRNETMYPTLMRGQPAAVPPRSTSKIETTDAIPVNTPQITWTSGVAFDEYGNQVQWDKGR